MEKALYGLFFLALSLPLAAQTVTNLAPGYISVTIPAPFNGPYTRSVILLHAVYDGALISKNYAAGSLVALRGSGNDRTNLAQVNTSSSYTTTHGSVASINNYSSAYQEEQWTLKKVRYNGVLYLALDVPYRHYQHNYGFRFVGWAASAAEQMKLVSYYDTQQGTVLNAEVYNSMEDFVPNNAEYHHYVKSVFSGKVGIGTNSPDAKLTVKGNIHAREVKVDLAGAVAPDYVFEEGYDLRSLEDVQAHIEENGHLPGIPSGAEMENNGIRLKEMNLSLLRKIEELTLYLLQQQKGIVELKEKVSQLQTEIK